MTERTYEMHDAHARAALSAIRPGYVMDEVKIELKNCYGIKFLNQDFNFKKTRAYAIYAPNGVMKSSLAKTFQDAAAKQPSECAVFF